MPAPQKSSIYKETPRPPRKAPDYGPPPPVYADDCSIHVVIYKEAPRLPRKAASPPTYGPLAPINATAPKYFHAPEAKFQMGVLLLLCLAGVAMALPQSPIAIQHSVAYDETINKEAPRPTPKSC